MPAKVLERFGLGGGGHEHRHDGEHAHDHGSDGHVHGVVDPSIAATEAGIRAVKWSFVLLAVTAVIQSAVVIASGSVALLADTIHNVGDAATAIPLWIAFVLARRRPSLRFTYGYGRVEDLAGVAIVGIILFSAIGAGYEAVDRLLHPRAVSELIWVAVAGVVGFLGNEAVAVLRIRVGRRIDSAALVADGYHARTDGLTSLAVVAGAAAVALGYPLADPLIGLLIAVVILGIVWQSGRVVFTRMLDGVEPGTIDRIRRAAAHADGVRQVVDAKARWIGHRLHVEVTIEVDGDRDVAEASRIVARLKSELSAHIPSLGSASVMLAPAG